MKFRKKPVVIEAVQSRPGVNDAEMLVHLNGCFGWQQVGGGILIPTLEGDHLAKPGDWIIKGVKGEFYPCKPDIFEATYEQADAPPVSALPTQQEAEIDKLIDAYGNVEFALGRATGIPTSADGIGTLWAEHKVARDALRSALSRPPREPSEEEGR